MEIDRCRDLQTELGRYATGLADERLSMRVQLHLAEGCAPCAGRLEELTVRFHLAALRGGPAAPPAELEESLLVAASGCEQEAIEPLVLYPETSERALLWTLVALSLLMVAAVAFWGSGQVSRSATLQSRALAMERAASISVEQLGTLRSVVRRVTDPRLPVTDLSGSGAGYEPVRARLVYDLGRGELWLRLHALPKPSTDQVYALWLGEPGEEQLVGSLLAQIVESGSTSHFVVAAGLVAPFRLSLRLQTRSDLAQSGPGGALVFSETLGSQEGAAAFE
jgi:hypothetical protein